MPLVEFILLSIINDSQVDSFVNHVGIHELFSKFVSKSVK